VESFVSRKDPFEGRPSGVEDDTFARAFIHKSRKT
jgi:hypothetical protein